MKLLSLTSTLSRFFKLNLKSQYILCKEDYCNGDFKKPTDEQVLVLLNGVKPQSLSEEDYISKQQMLLLEKLKKRAEETDTCYFDDLMCDDDSSLSCSLSKCYPAKNHPSDYREDFYFHNQTMESLHLYKKNSKSKPNQGETDVNITEKKSNIKNDTKKADK